MPNVDVAYGFQPARNFADVELQSCVIPASDGTAAFVGDLVKLHGTGDAETRFPTVIQAAAGDASIYGVIVGFVPSYDNLNLKYRVASTRRIAMVMPAYQHILWRVNASITIDVDAIGTGYDIVVGSGSTTTGRSAMELDVSATGTTGRTLRLLDIERTPTNDISASGGAAETGVNCIVAIVESLFNNGAGA
jgi:hypothetical protein